MSIEIKDKLILEGLVEIKKFSNSPFDQGIYLGKHCIQSGSFVPNTLWAKLEGKRVKVTVEIINETVPSIKEEINEIEVSEET